MTNYYLLIDAGNSLCKINLYDNLNDQLVLSEKLDYAEIDYYFKANLQQYTIGSVFICSVKNKSQINKIELLCKKCWACKFELFNTNDYKIIPSDYQNFDVLGADRWISILALHLQSNTDFCIIDCGTAITVDYVIKSRHLGGLIGPGLTTLATCLNSSTDQINIINNADKANSINFTSTSTEDCIINASKIFFAGFINSVLKENQKKYGKDFITYITGGDYKNFQNTENYNIRYSSNLVIEGLYYIKKFKLLSN